jgi:hypothetical protein
MYICARQKMLCKIFETLPLSPTLITAKQHLLIKFLHHCQLFRDNETKGELILDNNDLERERGITILSKNVSVQYKDTKINIIDTPGSRRFWWRGRAGIEYGRWCLTSRRCF